MRQRPTESERQAARDYLEHDYTRRQLTGAPAEEAHRHAEELQREHPRARAIALAGGPSDLGRLPRHLRAHQLRERRAAGINAGRAAELRRQGFPEHTPTRRRAGRERLEDLGDTARARAPRAARQTAGRALELADTATGSWGDLIGQAVLWGIGLSIAYLLLTHDTGVSKLFQGATTVTRVVVSPTIDPLNPKGAL